MSLWKIAWRNLQQRGFSTFLTGASVALGVTLMVAILVAGQAVRHAYEAGPELNHTLVVGPKGSAVQLVMNSVYHIDRPIQQTLPWSYYQEFLGKGDRKDGVTGKFAGYVDRAIPICKGDFYEDFQVIATTSDYFKTPANLPAGKDLMPFAEGEAFKKYDFLSAVLGSSAASKLGLKVGDVLRPTHSVAEKGHENCHHDEFKVTGILAPTGTPNDRGVFINIEGFFIQDGHVNTDNLTAEQKEKLKPHVHVHANGEVCDHDHHDPLPEEFRQCSAILLQPAGTSATSSLMANQLAGVINKGPDAQAALTVRVAKDISQNFVNPLLYVLLALTAAVVFASAVSILVSIYNSMNERLHDIAVMRALGARRETVMLLMFVETMLLTLLGGLAGWVIGHGLLAIANHWVTPLTGISLNPWNFSVYEAVLIPGLILLSGVVGYLPAMTVYKTDVAKALTAAP
jgi:putative ABC transport system permease protein